MVLGAFFKNKLIMEKKNMLTIILIGIGIPIVIIIFVHFNKQYYSESMHENGKVFEKSFTPEFNSSSVGTGISTDGKPVTTVSHVHADEQYTIFFKCQHGVMFNVNNKKLWETLERGDSVLIRYREVYDYKHRLCDYDFITALKK